MTERECLVANGLAGVSKQRQSSVTLHVLVEMAGKGTCYSNSRNKPLECPRPDRVQQCRLHCVLRSAVVPTKEKTAAARGFDAPNNLACLALHHSSPDVTDCRLLTELKGARVIVMCSKLLYLKARSLAVWSCILQSSS